MWYKGKVNVTQTYKKSCPSVLKGCWDEERGFCFEILVLKSTRVRILMLVAGGTDITADVRVLKSASPFWWGLLSSYSFVVHFLYLAHKAALCACMCRCGHPDMSGLSFVVSGSYRSQKAAQKQLWAITDRSERSGKDSWLQRVLGRKWSDIFVWTTEWGKSVNSMEGFIHIFIYTQGYAVLNGKNCYDIYKYLNIMRRFRV